MGEQRRFLWPIIVLIAAIFTWISNLIWPPLIIPSLLITFFGVIGVEIRMRFWLRKTFVGPIVACIWGGLIAILVHFGCLYVNSPFWFVIFTYLIGVFTAGYLGFRTLEELFTPEIYGIKDYHTLIQAIGIITYAGALLGLHLLH